MKPKPAELIGQTLEPTADGPTWPRMVYVEGELIVDIISGEVYETTDNANLSAHCDQHGEQMQTNDGELVWTYSPSPDAAPFVVTDRAAAEWVLKRIFTAQAELASVEAQRAAMNENFDRMAQPHKNKLRFFELRFTPQLESFAAQALAEQNAGKKKPGKTLALPHGALSFKTVPARVDIDDMAEALAWAEESAASIVKIERRVTKTDVLKAYAEQNGGEFVPTFATEHPARESFTVKTGL